MHEPLSQSSIDFCLDGPTLTQLYDNDRDGTYDVDAPPPPPPTTTTTTTLSQISFADDPELSQFASLSQLLPFSQSSEDEAETENKKPTIKQQRDNGEWLTTLKFDKKNFGPDALRLITGLGCGQQALGCGLRVTLNENKKKGTRFVFTRSVDKLYRFELQRLVVTTVAMARNKELNLHCRPTVSWVQSRYEAMLDMVYTMYHQVHLLYTMLFPLRRFDSSAVFDTIQTIIEGNKEEHRCFSILLRMARMLQFVTGSVENTNLVRNAVCREGVYGLLENTTISRRLEGITDLSGTVIQLHNVVYGKDGWFPINYWQSSQFPVAITALAISMCMVNPSTKETMSATAASYQKISRKRNR